MMCYNKPRKNKMPQSSEAKSYLEDIKLPLKEKPQLEVVKEAAPEVPKKIQKKIAKKVAACISAGIVASTGGFIALGETGHLPEQVQEWYDNTASSIRTVFGIEELKGKPAETIAQESKPPETTSIPAVQETTPPATQETAPSTTGTTPETTTEVITQNTKEIKNVEELIGKINLNIDKSMKKSVYPVKEVIFREPQKESEANFKKALAYAWSLILSKRGSVNDTADKELLEIPEDQIDARIDKLLEKINKGEDLRFSINIKDDYANTNFYNDPSKTYTVDLTKDVDIVFYGQIPDLFTDEDHPSETSHEFMIPFYIDDENGVGRAPCGWRFEVKEDGGLIIKISEEGLKKFGFTTGVAPSKEQDAQFVGTSLAGALDTFLINARETQNPAVEPFTDTVKNLYYLLVPGIIFENDLPVDKNAVSIFENIYLENK
ncbi:hypothetical protein M1615_00240 [Patescibacteria group bacterium]|nr:hypothetical protein [Patescibacteria group bacterium]